MKKKTKRIVSLKIGDVEDWRIEKDDDMDYLYCGPTKPWTSKMNVSLNLPVTFCIGKNGDVVGIQIEYPETEYKRLFRNGLPADWWDKECKNEPF